VAALFVLELFFSTTVIPWPFEHMSIALLFNFEKFISTNIILHKKFNLEEIIFEHFNNS
jgi:hypothetical protein